MQFANPDYFWLIIAAALLAALSRYGAQQREQQLRAFAGEALSGSLGVDLPRLRRLRRRNTVFSSLAVVCLVFCLLRPQWGFTWRESARKGVDVLVALDVSDSMLAEDVQPNRLTRAQREIADLLDHLQGDRAGLLLFAGTAFLEIPLTLDYGAFRIVLGEIAPDMIPIKGTNVEAAIKQGVDALLRGSRQPASAPKKAARDRALVLITDGEDFAGDLAAAGEYAKENNVHIFILGVGTAEGAPIPTKSGYRVDKQGSVVISKLNEDKLQQLARETGGIYARSIGSDEDTSALYDAGIRRLLEANSIKWARGKRWKEYFQLPLLLALLLLFAGAWRPQNEAALPEAKTEVRIRKSKALSAALFLFFLLPSPASAQSAERAGAAAREAFEKAEFERALQRFTEAAEAHERDYRLRMGKGASYYRLNAFAEAERSFSEAASLAPGNAERAEALYDAANSMVQLGELDKAIAAYEEALKLKADDADAAANLEYAKQLKQQQEQQQSSRGQQEQQQSSSEEQKTGADRPNEAAGGEPNQSSSGEQSLEDFNTGGEAESPPAQAAQPEDTAQEQQEAANADRPGSQSRSPGTFDPHQTLLDSIEEDRAARAKERMRQGINQLKAQERKMPEKDW